MTKKSNKDDKNKPKGDTRRGFVKTLAIAGAASAALGFWAGRNSHRETTTAAAPQEWTVEEAVEAYKKLESLIDSELKEAHKSGQTLKIILGEEHILPLGYLTSLMAYDIARRKGILQLSVEFSPEEVAGFKLLSNQLRQLRIPFREVSEAMTPSSQNLCYFIQSFEKNADAKKTDIRGIEDHNQHMAASKILHDKNGFSLAELQHPERWTERHGKLASAFDDLSIEREQTMGKNIQASSQDELAICGAVHCKGIAQILEKSKNIRPLFLVSYPGINQSPEIRAESEANQIINAISYPALPADMRQHTNIAEMEQMKESFRAIAREQIEKEYRTPYELEASKFISENAKPVFERDLPDHKKSPLSVIEILREVKKQLGHDDYKLVANPQQAIDSAGRV